MSKATSNIQHPTSKPEIVRCAAGGCEYLTRGEDGRLRECGRPATHKGNTSRGLRYCRTCVEYVTRGRHGIEVRELRPHELLGREH